MSCKGKKQDEVARSRVEAKYWAMSLVTCELITKNLPKELRFEKDDQMKLICDNKVGPTHHI